MSELWAVRCRILEDGRVVPYEDGPFDRYLAELVIADIGIDAKIPRGLTWVDVLSARLVSAGPAWLCEVSS